MIYYLTAARHAAAMGGFLATWGKSVAGSIRILTYEQILSDTPVTLPRATYIFSSIGGFLGSHDPPSQSRQIVAKLRSALMERYGPDSVINDPLTSMRRYALLRMLHERGINSFAAWRAGDVPATARYPLFLRRDAGTQQSQIPLLHNRQEYEIALAQWKSHDGLLAIELSDTRDENGIYRKYGAFVVGNRIVPRHLFFSTNWMVKSPDLTGSAQLAEEIAYLESNPHANHLREVCKLANIGYGRIDYAVQAGRLHVWEINITPMVANPPGPDDVVRRKAHELFAAAFSSALQHLGDRVA